MKGCTILARTCSAQSIRHRLRNKQKGSNNRHKLNQKIARLHQRISNTKKDWHFKLSPQLVQDAEMIFVEDINFVFWRHEVSSLGQRGMLSKASANDAFGQFVNILEWGVLVTNISLS